jgi:OOP family OmpA-OmpF porin
MLHNSPVGNVPFEQINGNHFLIGAGVEYNTRSGLGARAELISFDKDVKFGQLGLIYRMGRRNEPVQVVQVYEPAPVIAAAKEPEPVPEPAAAPPPPPPPPPVVQKPDPCLEVTGVLNGVNFHTDSARLTSDAMLALDDVAGVLAECSSIPVTIAAHTDSIGTLEYNQVLSERRAWSVVNYLDKQGINRTRLKARAFGETTPVDTNKTPEGRRKNRRVELLVEQ